MAETERVGFQVPKRLVVRARRKFVVAVAVGVGILGGLLLFPLTWPAGYADSGLGIYFAVTAPMWAFGILIALLGYRLIRRYNGLEVTEKGLYPTFRMPGTRPGQRTFFPLEEMDRLTVEEGLGSFTIAVTPWSGKGVVISSEDLIRFFGPNIKEEFPRLLASAEALRQRAQKNLGPGRGAIKSGPHS